MSEGYWREPVARAVDPLGVRLHRVGITANILTVSRVVMASVAAVVIGAGYLRLGLFGVLFAALPDLLDGAVAKAAGPTSRRRAFFDSTADRVSDTLITGGVIWFFLADNGGLVVMVPVAVMGVSWLISYQRAKAESLGFDAKGGIMERAERVIVLCVGLAFPQILEAVMWLMLLFTLMTASQRFAQVWAQATAEMDSDASGLGPAI